MDFGISLGLRVNAGHGINYDNVQGAKQLDQVYEFNIGHSIISRSITHGLAEAVPVHAEAAQRLMNLCRTFHREPMWWAWVSTR